MTFRLYFCTYNAGNPLLYANTQTLISVCGIFGAASVTWLLKKVNNKGTLGGIAFMLIAISHFISFFLSIQTTGGQVAYYMLCVFAGFGMGMMLGNIFGMMPDTAEYTYDKYGIFCAGFVSTFINFMLKVGQALAIAAASFLLNVVGYVPNTEQTGLVLFTMNFGSHVFVGICSLVCAGSMFAYKLDKKTYADIVESLRKKGLAN